MNKASRRERLEELRNETRTTIFYEAPHKLKRTLDDFYKMYGGERRIVLSREITKIFEEHLRFTIEDAVKYYEDKNIKGEFVIILEGVEKEEKVAEESIEELMEIYMNEGLTEKDAMKKVAKEKGITKSMIYAQIKKK